MRFRLCMGFLLLLGLLLAGGAADAQTSREPVPAAEFGEPFPAESFRNLNPGSGPEVINLGNTLGKKPVLLYYWIAGNPRADKIFKEVLDLYGELGSDKLALFGVAYPQPGRGADVIAARAKELGIAIPILDDDGFKIGQRVRVQSVPNVTLIDADGVLRLTNGAAMVQVLEYKMNLEQGIRRLAEKGTVGTYGYLPRYHPVTELVGKECPDFRAPLITTKVEQRLHNMLKDEQINVLIFWSVDCPHCRKTLPEWNAWLKEHSDGINVVSAAKVTNEASRNKTKEFCEVNGFIFPTLIDQDMKLAQMYQVTATPTVLIIGPDRVVDSILPAGISDFGRRVYEKKVQLLKKPSPSS